MEAEQRAIAASTAPGAGQPPPRERKNIFQLIGDWPLSRKIATGAVLVISLALFGILIYQARTADQQLLYANLTMTDAAAVTDWLKNRKIAYSLKNGGKDIWMAGDQIYQTRLELAANDLPTGGGIGFEIFDKQNFALTDYVQKVNYTRALQGELARTIASLGPVENARVHLALPEKRIFKSEQKPATASVILTLAPGKHLDEMQVQGIIHLVAGSITELAPENVKVIDSNGIVLEGKKKPDENNMLSVDILAFQQEIEHRLEMRAQDMLDKTMGKDHAMVRVSATLDFSKVEKTQELFDPEEPVIRSEQLSQESSGGQTSGGVPGVQSNLQGVTAGQAQQTPSSNKNSRTTNYEISKTISKTVNPVGTITKLSVSVLVADKAEPGEKGKPVVVTARTAEELKTIENIVSSAIGVMPTRGDVISVQSMPFVDPGLEQLPGDQGTENLLYKYLPFVKYGLIALGMLLIYFLLIRPMVKTMKGEVKEHYKTVEQLELEQLRAIEQKRNGQAAEPEEPVIPVDDAITLLRREVLKNQVPTAFIVKNWIREG